MLSGERVLLRAFRPEDLEPVWKARQDPVTWALTEEAPLLPQSLEEYVAAHTGPSTGTGARFAVEAGGELVGRCGVFGVDDLARSADVGLMLLPEHRGQGYGQDVLRVLLRYAFATRNLHRVGLETLASNTAALRCYAAVGFVEEGRRRERAWVEGAYEDVVLMSVLRAEWSG